MGCDTLAARRDLAVHQPVALGAVGAVAGITPVDVAALSLHHNVTTPLQAAINWPAGIPSKSPSHPSDSPEPSRNAPNRPPSYPGSR